MEGVFLEFENENALRSYPFAGGCSVPDEEELAIPAGVFVDAALYPVNPSGALYLSSVSEDGVFSISDSSGVIMTGSASGNIVELFDTSALSRHTGTLVASSENALYEFAGRSVLREWTASQTSFASSCVFPVVIDGVTSLQIGDNAPVAGNLEFANASDDDIRISSGVLADGRRTLRFDVVPHPVISDDMSIRRIICVVDGYTPFRISKEQGMYNCVVLKLDGISQDDICAAAHRENLFEMADTCCCNDEDGEDCRDKIPCEKPSSKQEETPETYMFEEVFIPPCEGQDDDNGLEDGADNAFYLITPNILGEGRNPISITLEDGVISPKTGSLKVTVNGSTTEIEEEEFLDSVTSKGVVIQIPGLSGGTI